jgi:hypothetical protein
MAILRQAGSTGMKHAARVAVCVALGWRLVPSSAAAGDLRTRTRSDGVVVIHTVGSGDEARGRTPVVSVELDGIIDRIARLERLDPQLVRALIEVESSFDCQAVSPKGAQGLMQLMPETARALGVRDAFDPVDNVRGGARYLRRLIDRFDGSWELGLASYNAGPEAVVRYGGVPPYRETEDYVRRVMRAYGREADLATKVNDNVRRVRLERSEQAGYRIVTRED